MKQIYDGAGVAPWFGSGSDLYMWGDKYALGQQTNGNSTVGASYDQPAGGPYALCGAQSNFVYTDFVAFHVKRVQAGFASF